MTRYTRTPGRRWLTRGVAMALAWILTLSLGATSVSAIEFDRDDDGVVSIPDENSCPTLPTAPAPFEAWLNTDDLEIRGFLDPKNQIAWSFASRMAQVICGAKAGSEIRLGFFFIRALGTMTELGLGTRPETDPETVWDALEYVHRERGVKVSIIIDNNSTASTSWDNVVKRLVTPGIAQVYRCVNGCFNVNPTSVWTYAINHEKYITLSDTTWANPEPGPHPVVLASSGNIARSQIRTYLQEVSLIYDDQRMHDLIALRHAGMINCQGTGCPTSSGFPAGLQLSKQRGIWVDPIHRHGTDAGRGTMISFSPQPQTAADYYIEQFDDVDCSVDNQIRIAMFKLTDAKSELMVESLVRLKKRGCDIELLMSKSYGSWVFSSTVYKALKAYRIGFTCSPIPMHTKLILIGPKNNNSGRILTGTANMSVSGLRYNEEHVVVIDSRQASEAYADDIRRLYGTYMAAFQELSEGGRSCR